MYGAGLASALAVIVAGGVQATNSYMLTAEAPKGKAAVHLILGAEGAKVVRDQDCASGGPQWVEDLSWIKESSDVTVSRLAQMFGVTRKAFYGWMEGVEPKKGGSLARIRALREILASLPTDLHRTAVFNLADEPVGSDEVSLRIALQQSVEEEAYRERLNEKLADLSSAIDAAIKRLGGSAPVTRFVEYDFPTV